MATHSEELDPKPYYVVEADEGQPEGGRYSREAWEVDALRGEHGGDIYNLAAFAPREGYSRDEEAYR